MKGIMGFLLMLLTLAACKREEYPSVTPVSPREESVSVEDPDWIKLEIPGGREAYAIAGDIDKTLLVSTWTKVYYTKDQGKTWLESRNFNGPVPGLLVRNDTVIALRTKRQDRQGNLLGAWDASYFTPDYGKTWIDYLHHFKTYLDDIVPIGKIKASTGVTYAIRSNNTPLQPGSDVSRINPSDLIREDREGVRKLRFSFKHDLKNVYLDSKNRLYVAASGGTYVSENNGFYCCEDSMPAVVYVSRKPLP